MPKQARKKMKVINKIFQNRQVHEDMHRQLKGHPPGDMDDKMDNTKLNN